MAEKGMHTYRITFTLKNGRLVETYGRAKCGNDLIGLIMRKYDARYETIRYIQVD